MYSTRFIQKLDDNTISGNGDGVLDYGMTIDWGSNPTQTLAKINGNTRDGVVWIDAPVAGDMTRVGSNGVEKSTLLYSARVNAWRWDSGNRVFIEETPNVIVTEDDYVLWQSCQTSNRNDARHYDAYYQSYACYKNGNTITSNLPMDEMHQFTSPKPMDYNRFTQLFLVRQNTVSNQGVTKNVCQNNLNCFIHVYYIHNAHQWFGANHYTTYSPPLYETVDTDSFYDKKDKSAPIQPSQPVAPRAGRVKAFKITPG
jgi:hypothetical protein